MRVAGAAAAQLGGFVSEPIAQSPAVEPPLATPLLMAAAVPTSAARAVFMPPRAPAPRVAFTNGAQASTFAAMPAASFPSSSMPPPPPQQRPAKPSVQTQARPPQHGPSMSALSREMASHAPAENFGKAQFAAVAAFPSHAQSASLALAAPPPRQQAFGSAAFAQRRPASSHDGNGAGFAPSSSSAAAQRMDYSVSAASDDIDALQTAAASSTGADVPRVVVNPPANPRTAGLSAAVTRMVEGSYSAACGGAASGGAAAAGLSGPVLQPNSAPVALGASSSASIVAAVERQLRSIPEALAPEQGLSAAGLDAEACVADFAQRVGVAAANGVSVIADYEASARNGVFKASARGWEALNLRSRNTHSPAIAPGPRSHWPRQGFCLPVHSSSLDCAPRHDTCDRAQHGGAGV